MAEGKSEGAMLDTSAHGRMIGPGWFGGHRVGSKFIVGPWTTEHRTGKQPSFDPGKSFWDGGIRKYRSVGRPSREPGMFFAEITDLGKFSGTSLIAPAPYEACDDLLVDGPRIWLVNSFSLTVIDWSAKPGASNSK